MQIIIYLSKYYDWEKVKDDKFRPTTEQQLAMEYKQEAGGAWLKRVLNEADTYSTVGFPPSEVQNMFEHYERIGTPKSEEEVIATYLEDRMLPHIGPKQFWSRIEVESNKDLEKYLNMRFGLNKKGK